MSFIDTPRSSARVRSISSRATGTESLNGEFTPESSGRFLASAMNALATFAKSAKLPPCVSSSCSCHPPTLPRPWIGGGGTGNTFASGITASFG